MCCPRALRRRNGWGSADRSRTLCVGFDGRDVKVGRRGYTGVSLIHRRWERRQVAPGHCPSRDIHLVVGFELFPRVAYNLPTFVGNEGVCCGIVIGVHCLVVDGCFEARAFMAFQKLSCPNAKGRKILCTRKDGFVVQNWACIRWLSDSLSGKMVSRFHRLVRVGLVCRNLISFGTNVPRGFHASNSVIPSPVCPCIAGRIVLRRVVDSRGQLMFFNPYISIEQGRLSIFFIGCGMAIAPGTGILDPLPGLEVHAMK